MKTLFLLPYPLKVAPSQRFRVEQYFQLLADAGHSISTQTFFTSEKGIFSGSGSPLKKAIAILGGLSRRSLLLFSLPQYDYIFIHREAAPVGPPIFEWLIAKVFRKKIIYDFDDAIWTTDKPNENSLEKTFRWRSKVGTVCRISYKVSCGNQYLANYAAQFNNQAIVNPTTIDTISLHNRKLYALPASRPITIGWTGSRSTLKYLSVLAPVFQSLATKYPTIRFLVIADQPPPGQIPSLEFKKWSTSTEIKDLLAVDIGIMPLPDDEWSKGKCGFKALQYMALEIPAVVSAIGVNTEIIIDGSNGFLSEKEEEWVTKLEALIVDPQLRQRIGKAGRETVVDRYSVTSNAVNFLSLFE